MLLVPVCLEPSSRVLVAYLLVWAGGDSFHYEFMKNGDNGQSNEHKVPVPRKELRQWFFTSGVTLPPVTVRKLFMEGVGSGSW